MWQRLALGVAVGATLLSSAVFAAEDTPQVVNPVGRWDEYEMIVQADAPLRGTLRQVYIDRTSGFVARLTGKLPYGTKLVSRDYVGVPDGKGGWKSEDGRLVPGNPTAVLVLQKERGWRTSHPPDVRIGEWEFGLYTPAGKPISADFEKACMPCHKQVAATDYNFLVSNYFADWSGR